MRAGYSRLPSGEGSTNTVRVYPSSKTYEGWRAFRQANGPLIMITLLIAIAALVAGLYGATRTSMSEPPLLLSDPPTVTKKRAPLGMEISWMPRSTVIVANHTDYTLQYPADLTDYRGQTYTVFSNSSLEHKIVFDAAFNKNGARCARSTGPSFDKEDLKPVAKLLGRGCFIHWHVSECSRIAVIEAKCVQVCKADLTECTVPVVEALNVTNLYAVNGSINTLTSTSASITTLVSNSITSVAGTFTTLVSNSITSVTGIFTNATVTNLVSQMASSVPLTHTTSATLPSSHNFQLLNGGASALNMTMPADMTAFIGKRMKICSISGQQDALILGGSNKFDTDGFWSVWRADANPCCITFDVLTASRLDIVKRRCGLFCTNSSFVHCIDPQRPDSTNLLHGWWKEETKGGNPSAMSGNGGSYFFVNMTIRPPQLTFYAGSVKHPREPTWEDQTNLATTSAARISGVRTQTWFAVSPILLNQINTNNLVNPSLGFLSVALGLPTYILLQPDRNALYSNVAVDNGLTGITERLFVRITLNQVPEIIPYNTGIANGGLEPDHPISIMRGLADIYMYKLNPHLPNRDARFTGSISGSTLTVTAMSFGTLVRGSVLSAASGLANNTVITARLTGTGGAGTYTVSPAQSVSSRVMVGLEKDENWKGTDFANGLMDKIITTGMTHETSIIRTFKTVNVADGLTGFRFATYHRVSPAAKVKLTGFTPFSDWYNATVGREFFVSAAPCTTSFPNPNVSPLYEDYSASSLNRTQHHDVCIFFDSSSLSTIPPGNPVLSVTYGPITGDSNHLQTMSAMMYWFYEIFQVALHSRFVVYYDPTTITPTGLGTRKPIEQWEDVGNALRLGNQVAVELATRVVTSTAVFYVNPVAIGVAATSLDRSFSTFTDMLGPYNVRPDVDILVANGNGPWAYNIARQNYIVDAAYPAWKTEGTTRTNIDNIFAQIAYPGGGGDEFSTVMVPIDQLPPAQYSYLHFDSPVNDPALGFPYALFPKIQNTRFQERFFAGRVNPLYTGGKNIGYMRIQQESMADPYGLVALSAFAPTGVPVNARYEREAAAKALATVMQYLKTNLSCTEIILDSRRNSGGFIASVIGIREFFGMDEYSLSLRTQSSTDNAKLYNMSTFVAANNAGTLSNGFYTAYPSLSAANYPNSVFTNGHVIVLTDSSSGSGGDLVPATLLGKRLNKQLGGNTTVKIFGTIDGRLPGTAIDFEDTLPTSRNSPKFKNTIGRSVNPIFGVGDSSGYFFTYEDGGRLSNRHPALAIDCVPAFPNSPSGRAGGCPLESDWENLVYPDLGVDCVNYPNTRPRLAGDTRPQCPLTFTGAVNPLSTVSGSTVVTVTTPSPHTYLNGDSIALTQVAGAVSGIPVTQLERGHIIGNVTATTFTIVVTTPATATASGVGGTMRIMGRSQWRDAWLEQAIQFLRNQAPATKREENWVEEASKHVRGEPPVHKSAREIYGRDVHCPSGVEVMTGQDKPSSEEIIVDLTDVEDEDVNEMQRRIFIGRMQANAIYEEEMKSGGLCLDSEGRVMVTPSCQRFPRVVIRRRGEQ